MKAKYTEPSTEVILLQSAQSLAYSDIPFDDLKYPDFVGPSSIPQSGPEVDIPAN